MDIIVSVKGRYSARHVRGGPGSGSLCLGPHRPPRTHFSSFSGAFGELFCQCQHKCPGPLPPHTRQHLFLGLILEGHLPASLLPQHGVPCVAALQQRVHLSPVTGVPVTQSPGSCSGRVLGSHVAHVSWGTCFEGDVPRATPSLCHVGGCLRNLCSPNALHLPSLGWKRGEPPVFLSGEQLHGGTCVKGPASAPRKG